MVFPNYAYGAGVAKPLSYQGRLTDANGSPLGGTGTTYCMRFSVWDVGTGGTANPNQLWPLSYATPYTKSITVTDGVFNTFIGSSLGGDDDLSTFDFSSNDTTYLNIDVNQTATTCSGSWDSLSPRQRLGAVAYARVAADVYGTALRTSPLKVGIGAGTGQDTPIWLNLDWKNTATTLGANCSTVSATNGAVWYNSSGTRALACINNVIVGIDNTNEITNLNITGNTAGTPAAVSSGAVSFAGGNNVTLSQNGNAITISAFNQSVQTQNVHNVTLSGNTAGVMAQISSGVMTLAGGNNITLSQNGNAVTISAGAGGGGIPGIAGSGASTLTNGTLQFANANGVSFGLNGSTMTASVAAAGGGVTYKGYAPELLGKEQVAGQQGQGTFFIQPMWNAPAFEFDRFVMPINFSNTSNLSGSATISFWVGIYTSNASTLSLLHSTSHSTNVTMSGTVGSYSLYAGPRNYVIPWTSTIGQSDYWIGIGSRTTTGGANMSISQFLVSQPNSVYSGNFGVASATNKGMMLGNGFYSATTAAIPASIAFTQIAASGSLNRRPPVYFFGSNTM